MRNKISVMVLGLLVLVFVCGATGGCGGESFVDSTSYQYPNWTPEGLIYCQKAVTHYRKYWGAIGGEYSENRGTDYYYVTLTTDGTNETTLPYTSYPYFSPLGTYVALISGETISIVRRADNVRVYNFTPTTEGIAELDWSPREDKLVYRPTGADYLYVIGIDGSNKVEITRIDAVEIAWRFAEKIVFFNSISGSSDLSFVDSLGNTVEASSLGHASIGSYPNYYSDGNYIFTSGNNKFYKINTSSKNISSEVSHNLSSLSPKIWINPKLSPDNQKVVGGFSSDSGIWLINIDGSNLTQLK